MSSYRRLISTLLAFVCVFVLFTLISQRIFLLTEGREMSFLEGLLFVAETVTSTGFGSFIPFKSPGTMLWATFLMIAGFVTMAVWLGAVIGDWMSTRLTPQPPHRAPRRMREHVIICGTGPMGLYLARRCREFRSPYILIDQNQQNLVSFMDEGYQVMLGDPRKLETLRSAGIERARALVAVMADADNASICLTARALRKDLPIHASLESRQNEPFLQAAGVTRSVMIKRSLGLRLGFLCSPTHESQFTRFFGAIAGLTYTSVHVRVDSPLVGLLRRIHLLEQTGAVPLGALSEGRFRFAADPDLTLKPGDLLIVAGPPESLDRLKALVKSAENPLQATSQEVLLLGFGDVGRGVADFMARERTPFRVLSRHLPLAEIEGRDFGAIDWLEGDATRQEDLLRAGVQQVGSVVVALPNDTDTVFATLIARQLNPTALIAARANSQDAVEQLHLAGADSALDLSGIGGVVLARQILPVDISAMGLEGLQVTEVPIPAYLDGKSLPALKTEARTQCRVIGIRRTGGELTLGAPPSLRVSTGEHLVLFGTETQLQAFRASLTF